MLSSRSSFSLPEYFPEDETNQSNYPKLQELVVEAYSRNHLITHLHMSLFVSLTKYMADLVIERRRVVPV
jgi:hypothetical protein